MDFRDPSKLPPDINKQELMCLGSFASLKALFHKWVLFYFAVEKTMNDAVADYLNEIKVLREKNCQMVCDFKKSLNNDGVLSRTLIDLAEMSNIAGEVDYLNRLRANEKAFAEDRFKCLYHILGILLYAMPEMFEIPLNTLEAAKRDLQMMLMTVQRENQKSLEALQNAPDKNKNNFNTALLARAGLSFSVVERLKKESATPAC